MKRIRRRGEKETSRRTEWEEKDALTAEGDFLQWEQIEDVLVESHLVLLPVIRHVEQVHDVRGGLAGVRAHLLVLLQLVRGTLPRTADALELARHTSTTGSRCARGETGRARTAADAHALGAAGREVKKVATYRTRYIADLGPSLYPQPTPLQWKSEERISDGSKVNLSAEVVASSSSSLVTCVIVVMSRRLCYFYFRRLYLIVVVHLCIVKYIP